MKRILGCLLFAVVLSSPAVGQARDLAGPDGPQVPAGPPAPVWQRPSAVLWDNGAFVTHPGGGSGGADLSMLQTSLGLNTNGFGNQVSAGNRVADDFSVPASGWQINTITLFGYQTGSTTTSTITAVNVQIWNGDPSIAGSAVVWGDTTTNRMASTAWTNAFRATDTAPTGNTRPIMAQTVTVNATLPAGTYWLDWQTDGTLSSGPWVPPVSLVGQTGKPGANAIQWTTSWAPLVDTGTAASAQDLPFVINGDSLSADLSITKSTSATTVPIGSQVTYTLTVANAGPAAASGVVVTDTLPAALSYVSNSCGAAFSAPTLTWNLGALANGANATCSLTVAVLAGGTIQNSATVASAGSDPVSTNNTGSASITGQQSVLEIPTLGAAGLALLGILLGIASIVLLRRRTA